MTDLGTSRGNFYNPQRVEVAQVPRDKSPKITDIKMYVLVPPLFSPLSNTDEEDGQKTRSKMALSRNESAVIEQAPVVAVDPKLTGGASEGDLEVFSQESQRTMFDSLKHWKSGHCEKVEKLARDLAMYRQERQVHEQVIRELDAIIGDMERRHDRLVAQEEIIKAIVKN